MPQMAPYSWLYLMLMFSMIFMIFNTFFHYIKPSNKISLKKMIFNYKFSTKW